MFRVGTDLSIYMMVVEMHTWCPDWKRVIIIVIVTADEMQMMLMEADNFGILSPTATGLQRLVDATSSTYMLVCPASSL
jgi:hypothetical protein